MEDIDFAAPGGTCIIDDAFPYQSWAAANAQLGLVAWTIGGRWCTCGFVQFGDGEAHRPGCPRRRGCAISAGVCRYCDCAWHDNGHGGCLACGGPGGER